MLRVMLRRTLLGPLLLGGAIASGCTAQAAPSAPSTTIPSSPSLPPSVSLNHPFVYVGHDTLPAEIVPIQGLDASRLPNSNPTMTFALWFEQDIPARRREAIDERWPSSLEGLAVWGDRFVVVTTRADAIADLDEPSRRALADQLDAWVLGAQDHAPLAFAIREGTGPSRDHDSWHRQSLMVAPERVFPILEQWFTDHPHPTEGFQGAAVATIVRTLVRFIDAPQERWIRAYQDPRWTALISSSLGHDIDVDLENACVTSDADLPSPDQSDLAFTTAYHVGFAARGRPIMGGHSSTMMLLQAMREHLFSDPWLAEAAWRTANGYASSRGLADAAEIAQTCLETPACPPSTVAQAIRWWLAAERPEEATAALERATARWPDAPDWAELRRQIDAPALQRAEDPTTAEGVTAR